MPEKMHDFGLLGKWSDSTLKAQVTWDMENKYIRNAITPKATKNVVVLIEEKYMHRQ